ncbi:UNVERIFIED_ORG: hypothetical protein QFZ59_002927 [Bacillus sp. B2I3]|nr:hypothetical protein [Bacillus sp. B2I3]
MELNAGEKVFVFIQNVSGSVSYRSLLLTVKRKRPLVSSAKEEIETIKAERETEKTEKKLHCSTFRKVNNEKKGE